LEQVTKRKSQVEPRQILVPEDLQRVIDDLGTEPTECMLCGGAQFTALFERTGKKFWECQGCELVFVHDIYPEFIDDTDHLDDTYHFDRLAVMKPARAKRYATLLDSIEKERKLGTVLEVGCGQGLFLEQCRKAGWEVNGLDVLPPVAEIARSQRGLEVFTGELHEAKYPDASFDVCFMSEVIEHIVDPVNLMTEIRRVLRPGGIAILVTGNAQSWSAKWRGGKWAYYRFGGHLHIRFFSPRAAEALAEASGFESVTSETRGFAFQEAAEVRGKWYRPFAQVTQGIVSQFAGVRGAGHRLRMRFRRAEE